MDNLKTKTKTRSCATCTHFMPSIKEAAGRGLCALYSLVMEQGQNCRFGYQPKAEREVKRASARS